MQAAQAAHSPDLTILFVGLLFIGLYLLFLRRIHRGIHRRQKEIQAQAQAEAQKEGSDDHVAAFGAQAVTKPAAPAANHQQSRSGRAKGSKDVSSSSNNTVNTKSGALVIAPGDIGKRFTDVAGCEEAKEELLEFKDFLKHPEIFRSVGARPARGLLMVGPPGNGKTLLAKALAGESGAHFLSISGSNFMEVYVGVGAARVRDLFEEARKHKPSIIFIDEIDAVGRKRSTSSSGGNEEREQTLNQLLVEMDGFADSTGLLVMAATNRVDLLDAALTRPGRFDRQIVVEAPHKAARVELFKVHTRGKPLAPDVDFAGLATRTTGMSGADIEAICNEASVLAARKLLAIKLAARPRPLVTAVNFEEAIDRIQLGIGGGRKAQSMSPATKLNTAVHELGHAWVAAESEHSDPVSKITILPRGKALGFTQFYPASDSWGTTAEQFDCKLAVFLAGRLAQLILLQTADSGVSDDYQRAWEIARVMVTRFGMSDLGIRGIINTDAGQPIGNRQLDEIDLQVQNILTRAENKAREIIERDREAIMVASQKLVDQETIFEAEWLELRKALKGAR